MKRSDLRTYFYPILLEVKAHPSDSRYLVAFGDRADEARYNLK